MDPVRPVWADNFAAESTVLRAIARNARHVAINVQYPGCVVHGDGKKSFKQQSPEERYELIRQNAATLKLIQVGIAIRTHDGHRFAWEFNIGDFDIAAGDPYAESSIKYLAARGINFENLPSAGIHGYELRWLIRKSGLLRARPSFATFTGAYHVAYFVQLMTGEKLPVDLDGFMKLVHLVLGLHVYDVKQLARPEHGYACWGGLKDISKKLGVAPSEEEAGLAGANALLTLRAFEVLQEKLGGNTEKCCGELCGLQAT